MPSEPMNIQEQGFRSSLFGFDKNDVLAYMSALANEAQQHEMEYEEKLRKVQEKLDELRSERAANDARTEALKAELTAANQRLQAAEADRRQSAETQEALQKKLDTYLSDQQDSQQTAEMWKKQSHELQQQVDELQKQLEAARRQGTAAAPAPDAVREARLEAQKILTDAQLYAQSAERELKQQADTQKTRMAQNARGIAAGVMLVRERLARVDQRLSAAAMDMDGLTQAIYQALDDTEAELKDLGVAMRDFAQGTPETDLPEPQPEPVAAEEPAPPKPPVPQFRVKATAQPVRAHRAAASAKPGKPAGHRLRSVRTPVSKLLQDELNKLDGKDKA